MTRSVKALWCKWNRILGKQSVEKEKMWLYWLVRSVSDWELSLISTDIQMRLEMNANHSLTQFTKTISVNQVCCKFWCIPRVHHSARWPVSLHTRDYIPVTIHTIENAIPVGITSVAAECVPNGWPFRLGAISGCLPIGQWKGCIKSSHLFFEFIYEPSMRWQELICLMPRRPVSGVEVRKSVDDSVLIQPLPDINYFIPLVISQTLPVLSDADSLAKGFIWFNVRQFSETIIIELANVFQFFFSKMCRIIAVAINSVNTFVFDPDVAFWNQGFVIGKLHSNNLPILSPA